MESINLLLELLKMDTSTKEGANASLEYCAKYLSSMGIDGEVHEFDGYKSYVATIGNGSRTLVLNGHLDVVSGKPNQFEPFIEGDNIYGRGSADMKSGVVAIMQALIRLKDEPLDCKVMLQIVTDEETGGFNCTRYLVEQGYTGDFAIFTEPTNMTVSIQAKGIMRLDIVTNGNSAHGSRPWEGENAILKAIRNFEKIENLPILSIGSEFYDKTSVNLALIQGGDIYNRVPDKTTMGLDIRYVPHIDPDQIVAEIRNAIEGEVIVKNIEPSINVSCDCEYVQSLKSIAAEITGEQEVAISAQHGSSDARFFSGKGIPAVEFGPKGACWHGDEEYVTKSSTLQLEDIIVEYAKRF